MKLIKSKNVRVTNIKLKNLPLKRDGNDLKLRSGTSLTAASNTSVVDIKVKQSEWEIEGY